MSPKKSVTPPPAGSIEAEIRAAKAEFYKVRQQVKKYAELKNLREAIAEGHKLIAEHKKELGL